MHELRRMQKMKIKVQTWCQSADDYRAIDGYLKDIPRVQGGALAFLCQGEKMEVLDDLMTYIVVNIESIKSMKINVFKDEATEI